MSGDACGKPVYVAWTGAASNGKSGNTIGMAANLATALELYAGAEVQVGQSHSAFPCISAFAFRVHGLVLSSNISPVYLDDCNAGCVPHEKERQKSSVSEMIMKLTLAHVISDVEFQTLLLQLRSLFD